MSFQVSLTELDKFSEKFWAMAGDTKLFAFHGEMGAGKTTIISTLCRAKGVSSNMGSPTFSIINEYAYVEHGIEKKIYHIDLYRLKDDEEVMQAGVEDIAGSGSICMIEWPGKAPHLFDEKSIHVLILPVSESVRSISVELPVRKKS